MLLKKIGQQKSCEKNIEKEYYLGFISSIGWIRRKNLADPVPSSLLVLYCVGTRVREGAVHSSARPPSRTRIPTMEGKRGLIAEF